MNRSHLFIITCILYLLAGDVLADITINAGSPQNVGYTSHGGDALLAAPRYKAGQKGDTIFCLVAGYNTNETGWILSYDAGVTWQNIQARWMTFGNGSPTWYMSDHSAAWFSDRVHIVFRSYAGGDPFGYRSLGSDYNAEGDLTSLVEPSDPVDTYYPMVCADDNGNVWTFDMSEGASMDNIRYWYTTDRFVSDTTVGYVCNLNDSDPQNEWRGGAVMGDDGYPSVVVLYFGQGFFACRYNGSTWDSVGIEDNASLGAGDRYCCHTEMNGKTHMAYFYYGGNPDVIIHYYENDDGTFVRDTAAILNNGGLTERADPQFCVYGEGDQKRLYMTYSDQDQYICVKSWTPNDGWDTDSTRLSTEAIGNRSTQMPPYVGANYDSIPVFWWDKDDGDSVYVCMFEATEAYPGDIYIRTLPYNIYAGDYSGSGVDTIRIHGTKLSSASDGIALIGQYEDECDNFYLDLGTDTVEFGTDGSDYRTGLEINGNNYGWVSDVTINGGYFIHNPSDTLALNANGVFINRAKNITLQNVHAEVRGFTDRYGAPSGQNATVRALCIEDYTANVDILGGSYSSYSVGYWNRHYYGSAAIEVGGGVTRTADNIDSVTTFNYSIKFDSIDVLNSAYAGMAISGALAKIYRCSIYVDARSDTLDILYNEGEGPDSVGTGNAYGVLLSEPYPGTEVKWDTIISGNTYHGGRGIMAEHPVGADTAYIYIDSNYVYVAEGWDHHYSNLPVHGLRVRYDDGQYLMVRDNEIICYGDTLDGTDAVEAHVHSARISSAIDNSEISGNRFIAIANTGGVSAYAGVFDGIPDTLTSLTIENNYWKSYNICLQYGEFNGSAGNIILTGDTVAFGDSTVTGTYAPSTFHVGYESSNNSGNYVKDGVYSGGTAHDDISFTAGGNNDIGIQRTLEINVEYDGSPQVDAEVWVNSGYADTVFIDTTDASGDASGVVTFHWESNTVADSTSFNDFTIWAKYGSDSTYSTMTVSPTNYADSLSITSAGGAPGETDKQTGIRIRGVRFR